MSSTRRYSTPRLPSDAEPSESGLLGPIEVHAICEALGVRPTKTLGQNFVHDAGTVRRIVRDAGIGEGTQVVEVGPGLGSLTLGLLEAGAWVRAIEIDPVLARALPVTVAQRMPDAAQRLHVVNRDAVQIEGLADFGVDWDAPTHLVANLPYNVAVPLLLSMMESFPSLDYALVMVQAGFANLWRSLRQGSLVREREPRRNHWAFRVLAHSQRRFGAGVPASLGDPARRHCLASCDFRGLRHRLLATAQDIARRLEELGGRRRQCPRAVRSRSGGFLYSRRKARDRGLCATWSRSA